MEHGVVTKSAFLSCDINFQPQSGTNNFFCPTQAAAVPSTQAYGDINLQPPGGLDIKSGTR